MGHWEGLMREQILYDIAVIGGGINGAGIVADAAGRGLSVFLCEKDDLASHTSSASSKLIHGGLRYLEHKEFRLVREALAEREVLLKKAPHIVRPMRFIMPHQPNLRPAWLIRAGLFFYDYLGKREQLLGSVSLQFDSHNSPLKANFTQGFEYSDCTVDDSRLTVLNAMQAREHGATIVTRTRCVSAQRMAGIWLLEMQNADGHYTVKAKVLVNAAGPWVASFIQDTVKIKPPYGIRLIQGSHIIVPKFDLSDKAFILQNHDQRIVFVIPYLQHFMLIGTTDKEYKGDPNHVEISLEETQYLIEVFNAHFKTQISVTDILSSYSGVRPLCDDESDNPSVVTRDYTLALSQEAKHEAPVLSVFGGKLTTYRKLAESALAYLQEYFPDMAKPWTKDAVLPGAENFTSAHLLEQQLLQQVQGLSASVAQRWVALYGTRMFKMLGQASNVHELGQDLAHGVYALEVDYLVDQEWAITADDILKRRTKLYLQFNEAEVQVLGEYLIGLHERRLRKDVA